MLNSNILGGIVLSNQVNTLSIDSWQSTHEVALIQLLKSYVCPLVIPSQEGTLRISYNEEVKAKHETGFNGADVVNVASVVVAGSELSGLEHRLEEDALLTSFRCIKDSES